MDDVDRKLLAELQRDATQPYAVLGEAVGLSAGAAHDRVRKLREQGVIRRTTVDVDPDVVGRGVLAFVMIDANSWMGDAGDALAKIAAIEEAHVVAGAASVLVKVRTASTADLQAALRQIFAVDGVSGTQAIVVLETFFERALDPHPDDTHGRAKRIGQPSASPRRQKLHDRG